MNDLDPFEVLDRPEIHSILFYPRKAPGVPDDEKDLFFEVDEGVSIGCRLYEAGNSCPTLLFFHGNGEIATDYDDIAPLFIERNINLLIADYRGYGFSSGDPSIASLLKDADSVFTQTKQWLIEHQHTGALFVMGRSLGSLCAVEVAKNHQQQFAGLIVESGSATNFRNFLHMYGLVPREHPVWEEGRGFFSKEKIRNVTIPTLIIHAAQDEIVPVTEGKALYENSGAQSKKLVIIPGAGHNDLMYVGFELYFKRLTEFIEANKT
ncbi:MAG: alpha/beta hydrolase [Deltaproteobacteria bacterium]|nr:alpha/beta hydrolase [Deltaproteobacteria bacterium]